MKTGAPPATTSVEAILSAMRGVIAERGPQRFTMSAVAAAAGVSRPTLYKWFPTREALLDAFSVHEEERFEAQLAAQVAAQRSPARQLDAALHLLVTYLDGSMGSDPIGVDPGHAIQWLADSLEAQVGSLVRLLGDAFEVVPAVRSRNLTPDQAAELILRLAYSHYLFPHPEPEVLVANLRSFAGLSRRAVTTAAG